jgi:acyl carrier protein
MPQLEQIERELRDFVAEHFLFGQNIQLGETDSFLERGLIDSTGVLELVSFVEQTYGFQIQDDELVPENFDSLAALTGYAKRKMNGSNNGLGH